MPNRLLAVKYNGQDCMIHLYYDQDKMDVHLLDDVMKDDLHTDVFTITKTGRLMVNDNADIRVSVKALQSLHELMLQQHGEIMHALVA